MCESYHTEEESKLRHTRNCWPFPKKWERKDTTSSYTLVGHSRWEGIWEFCNTGKGTKQKGRKPAKHHTFSSNAWIQQWERLPYFWGCIQWPIVDLGGMRLSGRETCLLSPVRPGKQQWEAGFSLPLQGSQCSQATTYRQLCLLC